MITRDIILTSGYKEWPPFNELANASYQKCIKDGVGKKYYIAINEYELSNGMGYDFEFRIEFEKFSTKITLYAFENIIIKEIEDFMEEFWQKLDGKYYEYYEKN